MMPKKAKILFLSRGKAARSKMAEGFLKSLAGERYEAASAATDPDGEEPLAVEVMAEDGVDISGLHSHSIKESFRQHFGYVIAFYDGAKERPPVFPFTTNLERWNLRDPSVAPGSTEEKKRTFRNVRDEIKAKVRDFLNQVAEREKHQEEKAAALPHHGRAA
jgi:arsenate reductase (thioredoxin)